MSELIHCPALLALELNEGSQPQQYALDTTQAAELADRIAADLARMLDGVDRLGLSVVAAVYDQAQLLRHGFPLFSELAELFRGSQRHARFQPSVLALGRHQGSMPSPLLEPQSDLRGSSLLLMPLVLIGEAADATAIGQQMETLFVERGMADAATAWTLQQSFAVEIAHVRYMTLNDLAALSAIQLDHVGLAGLWSLIELALWPRQCTSVVHTPAGQPWAWRNGGIEYPALGYRAVQASLGLSEASSAEERLRSWADWLLYQRQFQLTLAAHRITAVALQADTLVDWMDADSLDQGYRIEWLAAPPTQTEQSDACLHQHAELGGVAVSLGVLREGGWQTVAHGYPLQPDCAPALFAALKLITPPRALGHIACDEQGGDLIFVVDQAERVH